MSLRWAHVILLVSPCGGSSLVVLLFHSYRRHGNRRLISTKGMVGQVYKAANRLSKDVNPYMTIGLFHPYQLKKSPFPNLGVSGEF